MYSRHISDVIYAYWELVKYEKYIFSVNVYELAHFSAMLHSTVSKNNFLLLSVSQQNGSYDVIFLLVFLN